MSYTQPLFTQDHRYRVKENFESGPKFKFTKDEVLTFERDSYSSYDNSFVYIFRDENSKVKEWWLPEGQSKTLWQQFFEEL